MALTAWELLPFYAKLINELGYDVVLSAPCKEGNDRTAATVCFPAQIAHGAVEDLVSKGVDWVFLPYAIELAAAGGHLHGYTCPTTAVIPDLVRKQHPAIGDRILSPHIALAKDGLEATARDVASLAAALGSTRHDAALALERALAHHAEYEKARRRLWRLGCGRLAVEPTVVLAGRPYTTCAPEVNLALPRKIASRGYHVLSADVLPPLSDGVLPRNAWSFTQQLMNAVAWAKKHPNLHVCLLSCFSCGPDASVLHLARKELAGQTFCYLEIDSHTAHAGIETRVGAFLDIIEEGRRGERERWRGTGRAATTDDQRVP
jgi:predicted nucleotide-binding protein (sugar kinase/HSP70/actin superfamily)